MRGMLQDMIPSSSSVLGTRYSVLGTRYSVLGIRYSVFGTRYSVLGIRYSVFGTRDSVLGMYSPITALINTWYNTVGSSSGRRVVVVWSGRCRRRVESYIVKIVHSKKSICTHPVFGTRYSVLGIRYSVFGTRDSVLGMYSPITSLTNAWNVARSGRCRGSGVIGSGST